MEKVNAAFITSGDCNYVSPVIQAYNENDIPNIDLKALITTKEINIKDIILVGGKLEAMFETIRYAKGKQGEFNAELGNFLRNHEIELVFLLGCNTIIPSFQGLSIYNIHPADPKEHGGNKIYGLRTHKHVLSKLKDEYERGWKNLSDRYFTLLTIHEAGNKFDQGQIFSQHHIEIPSTIVSGFLLGDFSLNVAAKLLQDHVLIYEWMILPMAISMAAKKILNKRR